MGRFSVRSSVRLSVCPSVRLSVCPSVRPSHPSGPSSQAWLAGPQARLDGPEGGTDERTNRRTYERTDGKSPHSTGLRPLLGPLPKKGYHQSYILAATFGAPNPPTSLHRARKRATIKHIYFQPPSWPLIPPTSLHHARTSCPKASSGQRYPCPASLYWPRFSFGKQGSGPDRGRSPVEWGDFPYVRPSVHPSVRPYVRPSVPPSGPSSQA